MSRRTLQTRRERAAGRREAGDWTPHDAGICERRCLECELESWDAQMAADDREADAALVLEWEEEAGSAGTGRPR